MQPPRAISDWLSANYPKPRIDPEWLQGCYDWIISEKQLNPATQINQIIREVELQLLESDLRDSMLHGTGIPAQIGDTDTAHSTLNGPPILVQIESITDIGVSAYSLNKTRQIREERFAAGAEEGEGGEDEEADNDVEGAGPVPNYQRAMLRLELSDGATTLRAMEYQRIPELKLGSTPLGYKMLIHDVEVRRGIAFLEPKRITLKGHQIADRDAQQDAEFARSLKQRLNLLDPGESPPPILQARGPLREIAAPPLPDPNHLDDEKEPLRRRVPNRPTSPTQIPSSSTAASSSSSHLPKPKSSSSAPKPKGPIVIESDDEDENDENSDWLLNTRDRPIKPLPARGRVSSGSVDVPSSGPSKDTRKQKQPAKPAKVVMIDDDGDDDMFTSDDYNSDFLAGIDEAEMNAMQGMSQPTRTQPKPVPRSSGGGSNGSGGQRSAPMASSGSSGGQVESITIEDDEDEDENENDNDGNKENTPVRVRHVRRRTVLLTEEPLELSDSD
ncbi:hypothetical protein VNI00_005003 [Paramarasmius palmivorus]|uniref:RecQ-mediated genome instability protein 1 n=1 Tax=Paramarasmius palmivorus TaxID=297713 RepID=A0AAW0D8N1_9AGAR